MEQSGNSPIPNKDPTVLLFHGVSRFVQEDSGILFSGFIKQPEMQKEQDSYGDEVDMETMKALEIKSVRVRMEARKAAQSEGWKAILRTAGRDIDFDLDDLVALENRAQAEFDRVWKARAPRLSHWNAVCNTPRHTRNKTLKNKTNMPVY